MGQWGLSARAGQQCQRVRSRQSGPALCSKHRSGPAGQAGQEALLETGQWVLWAQWAQWALANRCPLARQAAPAATLR